MNTVELTERGLVVYHAWWNWATSVPARRRSLFQSPTLLSVHGYGSLFNYMITFTAEKPLPGALVQSAGAAALLGTPAFSSFLRLNTALLCPLALVQLGGMADLGDENRNADTAVFLADEQVYGQLLSRPCEIAVAYNNGVNLTASWDYGVYQPRTRTVLGHTGDWVTELDLLMDEYAVGDTVQWIRAHPRSVLFFAGGTRFYYSDQDAPMSVFLDDFEKYLNDTGRDTVQIDRVAAVITDPTVTIREHMETVAKNYILV
jgi:hypothetical protein